MKISSLGWTADQGWRTPLRDAPARPDLVLYFGARKLLGQNDGPVRELIARFPSSVCAGCSTAGEILGATVSDDSLVALCITFSNTRVRGEVITVAGSSESSTAAATLAQRLAAPDLCHILVLSDGLVVNGTLLTTGFRSSLPPGTAVTGGLAGDGSAFETTLVGLGNEVGSHRVVAIGFYGSRLRAFHGCASGWEAFGPRRLVTRSAGNILYSLDDQPALPLYKRYLGERAAGLPSTGLLFPLQLLSDRDAEHGLVRTILAVDEAAESLTFAGDIPQGSYVRLMKASCDALVAGAERSTAGLRRTDDGSETFAILVSCVGRRLVMGQRTEEEIDAVLAQLGKGVSAAGFYSYGEISPSGLVDSCDLHNQTMTLTVFSEEP
jgi:hypothetical protein